MKKLILILLYLKRLVTLWVDKLILKMENFKIDYKYFKIDYKFWTKEMYKWNLVRRADRSPWDYLSLKPSSEISFEYVA